MHALNSKPFIILSVITLVVSILGHSSALGFQSFTTIVVVAIGIQSYMNGNASVTKMCLLGELVLAVLPLTRL